MWTSNLDLNPCRELESSILPVQRVLPGKNVFAASQAGDIQRVKYLLTTGINVNALEDQWDSTALYYASLTSNFDLIQLLLENGANLYTRFGSDRCFYVANLQVRQFFKSFKAQAPLVQQSGPTPLQPLQAALRQVFLSCKANLQLEHSFDHSNMADEGGSLSEPLKPSKASITTGSKFCSHYPPPDVVLYVRGRLIEAHRVILSARSPLLKLSFEMTASEGKESKLEELFLDGVKLYNYSALYSLISFFYSDRLEVDFNDVEDLVDLCQFFRCEGLHKVLEKEVVPAVPHYMTMRYFDGNSSKKLLILDGEYLPEEERLPAALRHIFQVSLVKSMLEEHLGTDIQICKELDYADVYVKVGKRTLRCHQLILASRSEYFKTRLSHFLEGKDEYTTLPLLEINDLSSEAFAKIAEYMYTDSLKDVDPDQAEEMFDAATRYLMLPLKHVVADALLPHLEMASTAELFHWLAVSELYGVTKITQYCQELISCKLKEFAVSREFREMLASSSTTLPVPVTSTGSSSLCTCTLPADAQGIDDVVDQGEKGENCISILDMIFVKFKRCILG